MLNRLALALICTACLATTPASAQTAPAVAPLTVPGAAPPKVIQKQTDSFVKNYAAVPNPGLDQIARWRDPVCVEVIGLPVAAQAAKIAARIEGMAQSLGLRAAGANCRGNVEILFTDRPQDALDILAKQNEVALGYYHLHLYKQLKSVTHVIQAWYVTSTRADGVNTAGLPTGAGFPVTNQAETIDDPAPDVVHPAGCANRFTSCLMSTFTNVFIVADNKALQGDRLNLIADEMVMLALSQPRSLDGCYALPSVIDRFAKTACPGRDPPDGLTPADTAYLTALYSVNLERRKPFERVDIINRMAKILIAANAAAAPPADAKAR